ncbi:hypothetical protein ILUMI_26082 [Ignelater luminosus]|uniref:G-protein coupled receptors family 1 profile domain-containing protein n=1 Tax=Ignelater luminosus TaxID=2038154 RepID=A0A8K0CAF2_IGNLU|nr:hypothetical protein ILUMI_26082 [Ignelater luminosus]
MTNVSSSEDIHSEANIYYTISEVLVSLFAIVGNSLVITVFCKERRLRRRTNYYIVSLAAADLLVGLLGIPFALLAAVGLPTNLHACLFTVSLLVVLCTISIFCLVAVSVDRYWAILYPMGYSRHDSAPVYKAKITQTWLQNNVPDWPSGSLDLNPLDYKLWSVLEVMLCHKRYPNIESDRAVANSSLQLRAGIDAWQA